MEHQNYQRINLTNQTIDGPPGLPMSLLGLSDETLANLGAYLDPVPPEYHEIGYWIIDPAEPTPEHEVAVGRHVEMVLGRPKWIEELEDGPEPTSDEIDVERNRRIDGGFTFDGNFFQSGPSNREDIAGAHKAATDAIMLFNAAPGNLAWQQLLDPSLAEVFAWIAADNSLVPMDAQTVARFGYAALGHKRTHIFAARQLKDMQPRPRDFATNEEYWP